MSSRVHDLYLMFSSAVRSQTSSGDCDFWRMFSRSMTTLFTWCHRALLIAASWDFRSVPTAPIVELNSDTFSPPTAGGSWAKSPANIMFMLPKAASGRFSTCASQLLILYKSHADSIETSSMKTYSMPCSLERTWATFAFPPLLLIPNM